MNATGSERRRIDWWLAAIVAVAAVVGAALVSRARNWGLMTDELLYVEMSRNVAGSLLPIPQSRGEFIHVVQVLYPILIAPLVGPMSMPLAYPLIAGFNAAVMATAAIPVYLLTHYASGSKVAARWAAACAVALPWLALASKLLPDAAAYTAMLWAIYAIARTAGGGSDAGAGRTAERGDALVLLAIVVAYLIRNQFIVLFAVWIAVVILRRIAEQIATTESRKPALLARATWDAIWRTPIERPIAVGAFVLVALILVFKPTWLLGFYSATTGPDSPVAPQGLLDAAFDHLGVLAVALAGLPFVFGLPWLVNALFRIRDSAQHQTALTLFVASGVLLYVGASFNLRFGDAQVLERYVFYLAPLVLVAAACCFVKPPKKLALFALPAALGVLLLTITEPYGLSADVTVSVNHAFSPSQIGLVIFQKIGDALAMSISWLLLIVSTVVATAAWLLIRRGRETTALAIAFSLTLVALTATTAYSVVKAVDYQNEIAESVYGERTAEEKAWVDQAICEACTASIVFAPLVDVASLQNRDADGLRKVPVFERLSNWWDLEFWNDDIGSYYTAGGAGPAGTNPVFGPLEPLELDWESGRIELTEGDDSEYMVVAERDPRFQPQSVLGTSPIVRNGLALYRLTAPPTASWATQGLTRLGWIPADGARLRLYAPVDVPGNSLARVTMRLATAKPFSTERLEVVGAKAASTSDATTTTVRWETEILPGRHVDFQLEWRGEKGDANAHVEQITVARVD